MRDVDQAGTGVSQIHECHKDKGLCAYQWERGHVGRIQRHICYWDPASPSPHRPPPHRPSMHSVQVPSCAQTSPGMLATPSFLHIESSCSDLIRSVGAQDFCFPACRLLGVHSLEADVVEMSIREARWADVPFQQHSRRGQCNCNCQRGCLCTDKGRRGIHLCAQAPQKWC